MSTLNRERAELYARAEYYAWAARRSQTPAERNPITGRPVDQWRQLERAAGRAAYAGMARVCYRAARSFPNPMPKEA